MLSKIKNKIIFIIQFLFSNIYNLVFELFHKHSDMEQISFSNNLQSEDILVSWTENEIDLLQDLQSSNHKKFLQWKVIQKTMFINNHKICKTEFDYLQQSTHWNSIWKKKLNDPATGWPMRSYSRIQTSCNSIHHAYHIQQYLDFLQNDEINDFDYIFEFGGGYGNLCRIFHNIGFANKYIIFDLPLFSNIQQSYLSNTIPAKVLYYSDFDILKKEFSQTRIKKMLFIATWSLSESPLQLRENIVKLFSGCNHFLIAYQRKFLEIDNHSYFNNTFQNLFTNTAWKNKEISHIPNNYYLFGKSKSPKK